MSLIKLINLKSTQLEFSDVAFLVQPPCRHFMLLLDEHRVVGYGCCVTGCSVSVDTFVDNEAIVL
jgi:carbonic anhydrase/acetyltransferase-like protein (isoleucine patch superfamily)